MDNNSREALAEDELPLPFNPALPVVDEERELMLEEDSFERERPSSKSFLKYVRVLGAFMFIIFHFNVLHMR